MIDKEEEDREVSDELGKELQEGYKEFEISANKIAHKLLPIQRPLIIICVFLLMLLVFFMGFGLGANNICFKQAGVLDRSFVCHAGVLNRTVETTQPVYSDLLGFKILNYS